MNKGQELISIIMPAYNCQLYIEEAIKSVINQTYVNWELIVINDGSIDSTKKNVEKLMNRDSRIKLYDNEKNIGVSKSRNKGVELALGNWIAFLDSDDMWEKNKLSKQIEICNKKNIGFIFTGSSFIDESGKKNNKIFNVPTEVNYKLLLRQNVISCSSVLIKKSYYNKYKMHNDNMHEDYALWLQILKDGIIAYGVNEALLIYRVARNSKSGNKIKSIKMTYRVFKFMRFNSFKSIFYTISHSVKAMKKYL